MSDDQIPTGEAEPTPDEITVMLSRFRDHDFARMIVLFVTVAAHQYPDEIRKALAVVFSTEAIEDAHKRLLVIFAELQAAESALRHRYEDATKRLDEFESRIGAACDDYLILRKRCGAMQEWLNRKAAQLKNGQPQQPRTPAK